jgi:hypothetical protein
MEMLISIIPHYPYLSPPFRYQAAVLGMPDRSGCHHDITQAIFPYRFQVFLDIIGFIDLRTVDGLLGSRDVKNGSKQFQPGVMLVIPEFPQFQSILR